MVMDVNDLSNYFRAQRLAAQAKKQNNMEKSTEILRVRGIKFSVFNGGIHLRIEKPKYHVDFWPSTGKYLFSDATKYGRGIFNLLRELDRREP